MGESEMFCCARACPVVYECSSACVGVPTANADAQETSKPKASLWALPAFHLLLSLMGFLLMRTKLQSVRIH